MNIIGSSIFSKIGIVRKTLPEFNKSGARLVSAKKGIKLSAWYSKSDFETKDIVKVETDFGNKLTKIVSYKDKDGKLAKRIRTTYDKKSKTTQKMTGLYFWDDYITINRNFYNGKKLTKTEAFEMLPFDKYYRKKAITEIQGDMKKHISSEAKGVNGDTKFVNITCSTLPEGKVFDGAIKSNCLSGSDKYKLNRLSYFYKFNLKKKDFFDAIISDVIKSSNFKIAKPKIKFLSKMPRVFGGTGKVKAITRGNKITFDSSFLASEGSYTVNVINHEMKHCRQNELLYIDLLDKILQKFGFSKKNILKAWQSKSLNGKPIQLSKNKQQKAEKYRQARKQYKTHKANHYEDYRNNLLEKEAFHAGEIAENEYKRQFNIYREIVSQALNGNKNE